MQDGKFIVLCIDDDADVREGLRMIIESTGYATAAEADSGASGRDACDDVEPDMVLVDLMMETQDAGLQTAAAIHAKRPDLPIYLLSSVGDEAAMTLEPADHGLSGMFQKPINPDQLIACMDKRLNEVAES